MDNHEEIVYICSPYAGRSVLEQDQNVLNAKRYGRFALESGYAPVITHVGIAELTDDSNEKERNMGIAAGMKLLHICSEIWVFGDTVSKGMRMEIQEAIRQRIQVRWFRPNVLESSITEYSSETVGKLLKHHNLIPVMPLL